MVSKDVSVSRDEVSFCIFIARNERNILAATGLQIICVCVCDSFNVKIIYVHAYVMDLCVTVRTVQDVKAAVCG